VKVLWTGTSAVLKTRSSLTVERLQTIQTSKARTSGQGRIRLSSVYVWHTNG